METVIDYVVLTRPLETARPEEGGLMVLVKRDPERYTKENRNRFLVPPGYSFEVQERNGRFYLDLYQDGKFENSISDVDL